MTRPLPRDVLREADAIKSTMKALGYEYAGGGPYPDTPRMLFTSRADGKADLVVALSRPNGESPKTPTRECATCTAENCEWWCKAAEKDDAPDR